MLYCLGIEVEYEKSYMLYFCNTLVRVFSQVFAYCSIDEELSTGGACPLCERSARIGCVHWDDKGRSAGLFF